MNEREAQKIIKDNEGKANNIINDKKRFREFIEKVSKSKGIEKIGYNCKLLLSLLKDYFKGGYKDVPIFCILAIVGAFIYLLAPIDLIPDFVPVFGYVDDASVIAACIKLIEIDIRKYEEWKENQPIDA